MRGSKLCHLDPEDLDVIKTVTDPQNDLNPAVKPESRSGKLKFVDVDLELSKS
jgi:hypothetical protein